MSLDEKMEMSMLKKIQNEPRLIGLSLSRCIRDVILNKISVEQIKRIIARTRCESPKDWDEVIEVYKDAYWEYDPERAERITRNLLALNKIQQPRLTGTSVESLIFERGYGNGYHWIIKEEKK